MVISASCLLGPNIPQSMTESVKLVVSTLNMSASFTLQVAPSVGKEELSYGSCPGLKSDLADQSVYLKTAVSFHVASHCCTLPFSGHYVSVNLIHS